MARRFAEAYPSVRKWSSKVDIFSKKYIIVPINEKYGHPATLANDIIHI